VRPDAPPSLSALRDHLLAHSVRRGDFVLKSGRRSNWFVDAKQTACRPEGMLLMVDGVLSVLPEDVTAIGGLTMGADPVAFATAASPSASARRPRTTAAAGASPAPSTPGTGWC